jgi:hypothetical protein
LAGWRELVHGPLHLIRAAHCEDDRFGVRVPKRELTTQRSLSKRTDHREDAK